MKRRRRLFTPFRWKIMEWNAYWGPIIPPRSIVRAKTPEAQEAYSSKNLRIGYYGRTDGLNCVWFVNDEAKYFGTGDQKYVEENFEIIERSDETDLYGDDRPFLEPIPHSG